MNHKEEHISISFLPTRLKQECIRSFGGHIIKLTLKREIFEVYMTKIINIVGDIGFL